ncbi:MAG: HAMP domain-containing sensor histidine kinase, partial [Saprospiraceae bacterium]
ESGISDDEQREIMNHMEMDITKLQQVSDRFSKIGSIPELQKKSLPEELQRSLIYMKARASSKIDFKLIFNEDQFYFAMINSNLFSWVIENVIRNALDAMDGQGFITIRLFSIHNVNHIEIEDNGKGIPSSKFNTIFRPGYSTKSRGWGLGLSLAKRIIENYHNGKIYVKSSVEGEGTTITIQLPTV